MTSDETTPASRGRRAARIAETRRRIVEATLALHTTVGPARTTISGIAERAGVQRHTVYAHFPDDDALFTACSGLWSERNPFPDPSRWAAVTEPRARLATALDELYAFYGSSGEELARVFADAEEVPFIGEQAARMQEGLDAAADMLMAGRGARGRRRARLRAAVRHALRLETWHDLVVRGGLEQREAVALMTALADAAAAPTPPRGRPRSRPSAGGSAAAQAAPTSSSDRAAP